MNISLYDNNLGGISDKNKDGRISINYRVLKRSRITEFCTCQNTNVTLYISKMTTNLKKKPNFYVCFSNNIGNLTLLKFHCNKNPKTIGLTTDKSVIDQNAQSFDLGISFCFFYDKLIGRSRMRCQRMGDSLQKHHMHTWKRYQLDPARGQVSGSLENLSCCSFHLGGETYVTAKTTVVLTRKMKYMPESYVIGQRQVNCSLANFSYLKVRRLFYS